MTMLIIFLIKNIVFALDLSVIKNMKNIMKISVFILFCIQKISSLELSIVEKLILYEIVLFFIEKLSTCQTALGMQSGSIPDSAISVSSSYDFNTVGPKASR